MQECIAVIIVDDEAVEISENLTVFLTAVSDQVQVLSDSVAIVIVDNDGK